MLFIMCRMHLYSKAHTAGDLLDPVQHGMGSYPLSPRNKGKGSSRALKTSTKTTFTTQSVTEQETSLQQPGGDKDSGNKDTRDDRNNQQGQRAGANDPDDSASDSSNNSGSSGTSSVKSIL